MKIKKVNKELHIFFLVVLVGLSYLFLYPSISKALFTSPHANYASDTELCVQCHNTHTAITTNLLKNGKDFQTDLCYTCHDGSGSIYNVQQAFDGNPSHHPIKDAANPSGLLNCTNCHNPHGDKKPDGTGYYAKLLKAKDQAGNAYFEGNEFCGVCHGPGSLLVGGDHLTRFNLIPHNTMTAGPPSGTQIKCLNCHGNNDSSGTEGKAPHGSDSPRLTLANEEVLCFICHNNPLNSENNINILERLSYYPTASSPKLPPTIYTGNYTAQHNVTDADQLASASNSKVECKNCHNPHLDSRTNKKVNPDNTSVSYMDTTPDPFGYSSVVIGGTANVQDTKIKKDSTTPQETTPDNYLTVGSNAGIWRSLIRFDLSSLSSIPPGSTITKAYLILYEAAGGTYDVTFNIYPLTESWTEGAATWYKRDAVNNWSTAGGAYDAGTVATKTLIGANNFYGSENFDVTNLVSGWYQGLFQNNGMILTSNATTNGYYRSFNSSEDSSSTNHVPNLVVLYTDGTPVNNVSDEAGFCLKCHDGNAPAGVIMPPLPGANPPYTNGLKDIDSTNPALSIYRNDLYGEWHGAKASEGDARGLSSLYNPGEPYPRYYYGMPALPCTECHDPHGSSNIFHLKENIRGRIVTVTDTTPASIRTLCKACHNLVDTPTQKHHGLTETNSCFNCHYHRGKLGEGITDRAYF